MEARVKWVEDLSFVGESSSGHQVMMDGNSGDKAPSPMEMVLIAAGGCSAIDVVRILQIKLLSELYNYQQKNIALFL